MTAKNTGAGQQDFELDNIIADVIEGVPEGDAAPAAAEPAKPAAEAGNAAPAAQTAAQALAELEAPHHWQPTAKEAWKALHGYEGSRAHLEALHGAYGQTQQHVTRIEQMNSQMRQHFEPLGQFLAPYAQQWATEGMDVLSGLRQVMAFRDGLLSDPQGTILRLAEMSGIDLAQATAEAPYVPPEVTALRAELEQLKQGQQQAAQQYAQQQQMQLLSQVQAFEAEKDAQGNPKHPYFKEVLPAMMSLHKGGLASNPEDAYAMAVKLNPTIQAQLAAAASAEAIRKTQAANAQVAQTAAKGGVPRARPDRGTPGDGESLDDSIRAVISELSN